MNSSQLSAVFKKYDLRLANASIPAAATLTNRVTTNRSIRLGHIRWMCQEMMAKLEAADESLDETQHTIYDQTRLDYRDTMDKANRWLGFIQATLWIDGFYTIDEMKADNRT